jgi:hypothetical protein
MPACTDRPHAFRASFLIPRSMGRARPPNDLAPAERFLDALRRPLARFIGGMTRGASVERGTPAAVAARGDAADARRMAHDHLLGRLALGGAGRL